MPQLTGNSNFCVRPFEHPDRLAVIHMHEFRADDPFELGDQPLLDPLVEKGEVFLPFVQQRREGVFQQRFRQAPHCPRGRRTRSPARSSRTRRGGGWCSSSRRGRSARRCRPWSMPGSRPRRRAAPTPSETPRGQRNPARNRPCPRACAADWRDPGVDTRNNAPAPSASEAVMIGVLTQKKPFSSKKRWIALARLCRTRVAAAITLVRGRRCATSRRNSSVCGFGWIG